VLVSLHDSVARYEVEEIAYLFDFEILVLFARSYCLDYFLYLAFSERFVTTQ
jgi:hypothetical protein